jgi:hypothetical protein
MIQLFNWATRHNITPGALAELQTILAGAPDAPSTASDASESAIQANIRVVTSRLGWRIWRNNVGAGKLESGSFVRWGLANDTPQMNASVKSSDLVGIRPVLITQDMVGQTIGQFVGIEVKRGDWKPSRTDKREIAQRRWVEIVIALGGYAIITNTAEGIDQTVRLQYDTHE